MRRPARKSSCRGQGALRLHVAGNDFRLVLGFTAPWPFAAKHAVRRPDLPAQSSLDARRTLTALCRQLLAGPKLSPVENAHRLTETWVQAIVAEFQSDPANFVYLDAKACGDVDLGDKNIQTALLYDKQRQVLLVVYFNPTATDRLLKGNAREALNKKVERTGLRLRVGPGPRNLAMERDRSSGRKRKAGSFCTPTRETTAAPAAAPSPVARCGRTCARRWKRGRRRCVYITSERMIKIPGPHRAGPFLDGRSDSFWRKCPVFPAPKPACGPNP